MVDEIVIDSPLDMHLHLRDGEMLKSVAPLSAADFSGALVMPNLLPPVTDADMLDEYRERIVAATEGESFEPYMTLFFKSEYDYRFLSDIRDRLTAVKLYPAGITTNSESGISSFDIESLGKTLEAMSSLGIPLCVHGETEGFVMDREKEFLPVYELLAKSFPDLIIIMEHITTAESASVLSRYDNLFATITLHHLLITLDDVAGGMLKPHLFCKPIAKRFEDREALLELALNAHPKVMFGSDSAPHPRSSKEASACAAGIFTAPFALPALAELFEKHNRLENLQKFVSDNARRIYSLEPPAKMVNLHREPWVVPDLYGDVVPMLAGDVLNWKVGDCK